jgi:hypothetical protein
VKRTIVRIKRLASAGDMTWAEEDAEDLADFLELECLLEELRRQLCVSWMHALKFHSDIFPEKYNNDINHEIDRLQRKMFERFCEREIEKIDEVQKN